MKRISLALALLAAAAPLRAQSLLYRPPNLGGTWVPDAGVVQFNFLHRFYVFPGPSHFVENHQPSLSPPGSVTTWLWGDDSQRSRSSVRGRERNRATRPSSTPGGASTVPKDVPGSPWP